MLGVKIEHVTCENIMGQNSAYSKGKLLSLQEWPVVRSVFSLLGSDGSMHRRVVSLLPPPDHGFMVPSMDGTMATIEDWVWIMRCPPPPFFSLWGTMASESDGTMRRNQIPPLFFSLPDQSGQFGVKKRKSILTKPTADREMIAIMDYAQFLRI